jgi:hypothetical protein
MLQNVRQGLGLGQIFWNDLTEENGAGAGSEMAVGRKLSKYRFD